MTPPEDQPEEGPPRYVLHETERYEVDRDALFFERLARDPDYAGRWLKRLGEVTDQLVTFPGPLSHAREEDASDRYGREVRRLLYHGPTRRRTKAPVRVLFTILPPDPADPPEDAEAVILLLRLLHGGQMLAFDDPV